MNEALDEHGIDVSVIIDEYGDPINILEVVDVRTLINLIRQDRQYGAMRITVTLLPLEHTPEDDDL